MCSAALVLTRSKTDSLLRFRLQSCFKHDETCPRLRRLRPWGAARRAAATTAAQQAAEQSSFNADQVQRAVQTGASLMVSSATARKAVQLVRAAASRHDCKHLMAALQLVKDHDPGAHVGVLLRDPRTLEVLNVVFESQARVASGGAGEGGHAGVSARSPPSTTRTRR